MAGERWIAILTAKHLEVKAVEKRELIFGHEFLLKWMWLELVSLAIRTRVRTSDWDMLLSRVSAPLIAS